MKIKIARIAMTVVVLYLLIAAFEVWSLAHTGLHAVPTFLIERVFTPIVTQPVPHK